MCNEELGKTLHICGPCAIPFMFGISNSVILAIQILCSLVSSVVIRTNKKIEEEN